ncbi:MAG: protein-disulfide reductase DsbD domain-containing protein, partial [Sphingomicrobium sp.]
MRRFLALILLFLAAAPAAAQFDRLNQPPTEARANAITPELVVNARAVPGGRAELAIFMRVRAGWHGYWLNPGDAGLPMSVEWELPAGWTVETFRYPVPHRLLVSGIVNYVYESDYAVLTTLAVPAGATGSRRIAAEMHWLACTDTICVPEKGRVELEVPTSSMASPDPRFNAWRQALPRPLSSVARFERSADIVRIGVPLPASVTVTDPYFYPNADGAIDYSAEQLFSRDGDKLIAELKVGDDPPTEWRGVLAYGDGQGLEIRAVPGPVPSGGNAIGGAARTGFVAAILGALLGGMLLNLMPCVFPILAMKALHLARAGGDERTARRDALGYAAGAVAGTAGLGALLLLIRAGGSSAGWAFQLQDPRTTLLLLLLATAITLNLLRAFELPVLGGEASRVGSFGTGALAAFVATPCSGPFMGAALGAALLMPLWGSVAVFAALGLGLALPFVAVAFVPALRRRLPRPGPWMARLQRFLAVPMAATIVAALWLLYRQTGTGGFVVGLAATLLLGLA